MPNSRVSGRIVTVTANTALDHVITVDRLDVGRIVAARAADVIPSGKGVNVARIASLFGSPVIALGLVGHDAGEFFDALNSETLSIRMTRVPGRTRMNVTILDTESRLQTHVKTPGLAIDREAQDALQSQFLATVRAGDIAVLSGSAPTGSTEDFYETLIRSAKAAGAIAILDASGRHLKSGLRGEPNVVKPNVRELEEFVGRSLDKSVGSLTDAAREMAKAGASRVVVSRAGDGAIAVERSTGVCFSGNVTSDVRPVSTVGCGDAMVAGLAVGVLQNRSWDDTLKLALACATAKLASVGPGTCRIEDVNRLLGCVELKSVAIPADGEKRARTREDEIARRPRTGNA